MASSPCVCHLINHQHHSFHHPALEWRACWRGIILVFHPGKFGCGLWKGLLWQVEGVQQKNAWVWGQWCPQGRVWGITKPHLTWHMLLELMSWWSFSEKSCWGWYFLNWDCCMGKRFFLTFVSSTVPFWTKLLFALEGNQQLWRGLPRFFFLPTPCCGLTPELLLCLLFWTKNVYWL